MSTLTRALQLHYLMVPLGMGKRPDAIMSGKAISFLKNNPFAKIVVIVDTHSTQDGQVVHDDSDGVIQTAGLGVVIFLSAVLFTNVLTGL
jgi:hypothetical protein